jgi:hypothetical protein
VLGASVLDTATHAHHVELATTLAVGDSTAPPPATAR